MNHTGKHFNMGLGLNYDALSLTTGCRRVSDGCRNCTAAPIHKLLKQYKVKGYEGHFHQTIKGLHAGVPLPPKGDKKAKKNYMVSPYSDLFCEDITDNYLREVLDLFTGNPDKNFIIITKRPLRMLNWAKQAHNISVPFPSNIYLGVSIENKRTWRERVPLLRHMPSANRFLFCQPLLSDLSAEIQKDGALQNIDWVVAGEETGPNARPAEAEWFAEISAICTQNSVPFFMESYGRNLSKILDPSTTPPTPLKDAQTGTAADSNGGEYKYKFLTRWQTPAMLLPQ